MTALAPGNSRATTTSKESISALSLLVRPYRLHPPPSLHQYINTCEHRCITPLALPARPPSLPHTTAETPVSGRIRFAQRRSL